MVWVKLPISFCHSRADRESSGFYHFCHCTLFCHSRVDAEEGNKNHGEDSEKRGEDNEEPRKTTNSERQVNNLGLERPELQTRKFHPASYHQVF